MLLKNKIYLETSEGVCHRRLLDLKKITSYLSENGFEISSDLNNSHYVILYTCAFNQYMEDESFIRLDRLIKEGREVIVAGCSPIIASNRLEKYNVKVVPHREYHKFDKLLNSSVAWDTITEKNIRYSPEREKIISRTLSYLWKLITKYQLRRYDIQVEWGCLSNCSYCADKFTVGDTKSKKLEQCIDEFDNALLKGYTDIKILGDDVGSYGVDIGTDFIELLDRITRKNGVYNLTVKELNVYYIVKYIDQLIPIVKRGKIKTLHIGFQSGNDRILSLMKREYTREQVIKTMERLTPLIPITCSIIVGFPSESESEFEESLNLLEMFNYLGGDVFVYQDRKGTAAFDIVPKNSEKIKLERLKVAEKRLRKLYNIRMYEDKFYFDKGIINRIIFKIMQKVTPILKGKSK